MMGKHLQCNWRTFYARPKHVESEQKKTRCPTYRYFEANIDVYHKGEKILSILFHPNLLTGNFNVYTHKSLT